MLDANDKRLIEKGIRVSGFKICQADKIWSHYSNDKVNIGEELAHVIRLFTRAFPISKPLRALSIGSSAEPQFRILENTFRGGLYLLDVDREALDIVKERVRRQRIDHVNTIRGDYNKIFTSSKKTEIFLKGKLRERRINLIAMHHSLYYSQEKAWLIIFENLYRKILAPKGVIHAVLMSAKDDNECSTTWLYNHFVGRFFGCYNDQNLLRFKRRLESMRLFKNGHIISKTDKISFFTDDFEKFMSVIWMILLYPHVHKYNLSQREEITTYIYEKFWKRKRPIVQLQNHLMIYRGI